MPNPSACAALAQSPTVRGVLAAAQRFTGMAIALLPAEAAGHDLTLRAVSPFCRLILGTRGGCRLCQAFLAASKRRLKQEPPPLIPVGQPSRLPVLAASRPQPGSPPRSALQRPLKLSLTRRCFAGLEELAVPIRVNGRLAAILSCGQFFCGKRTRAGFQQILRRLQLANVRLPTASARRAYFQTTVVSRAALRAVEPLLQVLAQHVQGIASQGTPAGNDDELPCVARARAFVATHLAEGPKTHDAARAAHVTLQYFCRAFKAATGLTFSEYVARCRVDQAKQLLQHPARRITEVAFAAGFQSIAHFNHTFKRYTGLSPTAWRASLRQ